MLVDLVRAEGNWYRRWRRTIGGLTGRSRAALVRRLKTPVSIFQHKPEELREFRNALMGVEIQDDEITSSNIPDNNNNKGWAVRDIDSLLPVI